MLYKVISNADNSVMIPLVIDGVKTIKILSYRGDFFTTDRIDTVSQVEEHKNKNIVVQVIEDGRE